MLERRKMNIITQNDLNDKISTLAKNTKKAIDNLKALHRREKDIKQRQLIHDWVECYLDLCQIREDKIDFDNDPDFLKLARIRDEFIKLMR